MKFYCTLFLGAACLLVSTWASATTYKGYNIHGNSCTSTTQGATPIYSQYGPYAPGLNAINMTCPVTVPSENYTYAYLLVNGYNRNSVDHLSCTIAGTDYQGTNLISATATLPYTQSSSQVWSTSISPSAGNSVLYVTCHLPALSAAGYSHLTYIWLDLGY